jgi:hypothetical protein
VTRRDSALRGAIRLAIIARINYLFFAHRAYSLTSQTRDDSMTIHSTPAAQATRAQDALCRVIDAVLLFHAGHPWTPERQAQWEEMVGRGRPASTRALCDFLRETARAGGVAR